ncbi:DNA-directed RNA polymerase subunit epsilon [Pisciglobus halotolerans]|uniref:DNA-directed RNA polymerase subunit epsilon n=1 Tax=Pisciglobus halotolerans TaxID=745365 RepID=A0A1I3BET5_9LACT|nr:DNA-directed RNA polymerase subunit epsilon [Pisciglobus halotolerans]SFH60596.1 DNA-dependent RNA polymerase auxiliary subunit epsilon [Pisciglobus halotolerans]
MIFKVTYQEDKISNPKREKTKALYIETESAVEARYLVEQNTPYNIEYVQLLDEKYLAYEQKSPDFKLTEFN